MCEAGPDVRLGWPLGRIYLGMECELPNAFFILGGVAKLHLAGAFFGGGPWACAQSALP